MPKGVKICIAAVVLLFIVSVGLTAFLNRPAESRYIQIVQDGEILYTIDIANAKNQEIKIDGKNGGYNIVEIKDGQVKISDADCPDQTCIKTGVLHSEDVPIVCLPHRLIIKFSGNGGQST